MKLEIELVPQSSFYKNVRSMVDKEVWDRIRRKVYQEAGYKCQICNGIGEKHPVECHEIWEYEVIKKHQEGIQRLLGFQALCPKCHQVKHYGLSQMRGLEEECIKHLAKINQMSIEDVNDYVEACWEIWRARNEIQWKVDLGKAITHGDV